ncbi:putative aldo/keto reductase [Xylaria acuta]|nr:putative aldo/keto reductase [Xylaria acuta]
MHIRIVLKDGHSVQDVSQGFVIGTKVLVLSKEANGILEPAKIADSLSGSRERLRLASTQKIGVLHCHAPDYTTPIQDQAAALDSLHNPVAGGMLSGKLTSGDIQGTRFAKDNVIGAFSKMQYDKKELRDAVRYVTSVLEPAGMSKIEAGLRWFCYHLQLRPEDGIILGASKPHYLEENVATIREGPLPDEIVAAIEKAWETLSGQ